MHILQPKHSKLKKEEVEKLLEKYNLSLSQLPKISKKDPALLSMETELVVGSIIRVERKTEDGIQEYFRVVV